MARQMMDCNYIEFTDEGNEKMKLDVRISVDTFNVSRESVMELIADNEEKMINMILSNGVIERE